MTDGKEEWVKSFYVKPNGNNYRTVSLKCTKALRFSKGLPPFILSGEKTITWRCDDEKDIKAGDLLLLTTKDGAVFGQGEVLWVKHTTFGQLTDEDKQGHEKFTSDEEMYRTYSRYYKMTVNESTLVKVIKFRLT